MLFQNTSPFQKRASFREKLKSGKLLRFPGAWSPLVAMQIEKMGIDGVEYELVPIKK
jgi:methylisocitrate lyase